MKNDRDAKGLYISLGLLGFIFTYRRLSRREFTPAPRSGRPYAVVSGASSGIGEAFARRLAARGYNLMLVARREDRLNALAAQLRIQHGVEVAVSPADLSMQKDIDLAARVIRALPRVDILVNNAGFGAPGPFAESDLRRQMDMVRLHDIASMALTHAVLPGMIAHGGGAVINLSSTASFYPLPWNASYSASKSFLTVFSEALHSEVAGKGVVVQALCPGFVHSEFHDRIDGQGSKLPAIFFMSADEVARQSLDALGRGPVVFVPGLGNRLIALAGRSPLRRLAAWVAGAVLTRGQPS